MRMSMVALRVRDFELTMSMIIIQVDFLHSWTDDATLLSRRLYLILWSWRSEKCIDGYVMWDADLDENPYIILHSPLTNGQ